MGVVDRGILETKSPETLAQYSLKIVPDAEQLVAQGEPMAGVIVVPDRLGIGRPIFDLELLLESYSESDMRNHIEYLPV